MNASLNEKLRAVKWGEYNINKLFSKIQVNSLKYKTYIHRIFALEMP